MFEIDDLVSVETRAGGFGVGKVVEKCPGNVCKVSFNGMEMYWSESLLRKVEILEEPSHGDETVV